MKNCRRRARRLQITVRPRPSSHTPGHTPYFPSRCLHTHLRGGPVSVSPFLHCPQHGVPRGWGTVGENTLESANPVIAHLPTLESQRLVPARVRQVRGCSPSAAVPGPSMCWIQATLLAHAQITTQLLDTAKTSRDPYPSRNTQLLPLQRLSIHRTVLFGTTLQCGGCLAAAAAAASGHCQGSSRAFC